MSSLPSVSAKAESPGAGFSPSSDRADLRTPEMSVADAFSLLATAPAEEAGRRVRKLDSKADPEVLHKLRVALRRLRSLWWAYEPLLDRKDAKFQRGEFKSLATAAGKTRDWDVLRDLLLAGESMQYSFTSLLGSVDEHRADAVLQPDCNRKCRRRANTGERADGGALSTRFASHQSHACGVC
jgi:hypothetical protein